MREIRPPQRPHPRELRARALDVRCAKSGPPQRPHPREPRPRALDVRCAKSASLEDTPCARARARGRARARARARGRGSRHRGGESVGIQLPSRVGAGFRRGRVFGARRRRAAHIGRRSACGTPGATPG